MATIQSKYLGRDFNFEPVQMSGDDGNPITIIPHNILFDIIQNQLTADEAVSYKYQVNLVSRDHCFIECTMTDKKGRFIQEFGESVPETLKSDIAKTIPGTMAAIRAFDRAAIRFLDFACEGKVYSDNEISTDSLKPAVQPKTAEAGTKPKSTAAKKEEKAAPKSSSKQKTAPATTFSMLTPATTKIRDEVLSALGSFSEMIVFDTETTGVKTDDRITELAAKKYLIDAKTGTFKQSDEIQLYINPERPLDPEVVELTGLTDEFLADKPTETEAFIDVYNFFGDNPQILNGYNTGFDIRFLTEMYKRQGKELKYGCKLDVCMMAKELVGGTENHKLSTVATAFGLVGDDFHTALADADYTMQLFERFVSEYRKQPVSVQTQVPAVKAPELKAPAKEESTPESEGKIKPSIKSMSLFSPSTAIRRIYVNTDAQNVYYDLVKKKWFSKDGDISQLDMEYLEKEAWQIAGASTQEAFEAYNGRWSADSEQKAA